MLKPQTAAILVPGVEETDRLVFRVQSRSRKRKHIVDMEKRGGLGECYCEDCQKNLNGDCWHIQQTRKYLAVRLVQAVKQSHEQRI